MTKKSDPTTIVAVAAVTLVAGIASYMLFRTYNAVKKLEEIDLDFGNDDALLSVFNIRNKMRDYE